MLSGHPYIPKSISQQKCMQNILWKIGEQITAENEVTVEPHPSWQGAVELRDDKGASNELVTVYLI